MTGLPGRAPRAEWAREDAHHAADPYTDHQLVARAAWEAARLPPGPCDPPTDPPTDRCRAVVFGAALEALRATLGGDAFAALRRRYDANHHWFVERLAARGG